MAMSRKDYIAIAAIVRNEVAKINPTLESGRAQSIWSMANELANQFKRTNSLFRYDTFFEACGLDYNGNFKEVD